MHQLVQVYTRLTATDTSFRVKETVNAQISRFSAWIAERRKQIEKNRKWRAEEDRLARGGDERFIARSKERADEAKKEDEEERRAIQLTEFLVGQRKDYISRFLDPTWENCSDICHLLSLPFDGFIAKCLCINDHNINLGNHHNIFYYSVEHCCYLYSQEFDDVMRIVSHVDLFSAVRSFVLSFALTDSYSYSYEDVLEVIIGDRTTEVLHFLCEFLSTPRDWSCIDPSGASAVIVIAAGSPPQFPPDLDLSPIIAHIARRRSGWNWGEVNDTLIAYLVRCEISALSERVGVHEFLQNCVDRDSRDKYGFPYDASEETRHAARTLLDQHRALFNPPCPPSRHSASINDAEDIHVPWLFDQSPDVPDSNSDQSHSSHDVPSTSEPGDPPETHTPPVDMPLPLAANIRLPSEDHELIDMSAPSEPGT
ncbi:hypothetical protein SISSUDRAFT_561701 [Sistotremastrum suecicum HHB10207 ss-3]|uniref:Uncharacterized protein n=1 Tax=Sistotremastrum suecicum HHB10207 ss-3 TaxID=1314776 RepID=A0A165XJD5_9AGAM|nr:hypothetical protein SISSUDRAFT_561701 [Sistotremastrum suecicum HHB10207 ss-3]